MSDLAYESVPDTQVMRPDSLLKVERRVCQTSNSCPWLLVSLCIDQAKDAGFSLDEFFRERGINRPDLSFVGRLMSQESFDLVVHHSFLDTFVAKLHDFLIERDYNPTRPTEREICVYGAREAQRRAEADFLDNAVEAVSYRWGPGPAQCYHATARTNDLSAELDQRIVVRYVLVNVHVRLATNLLLTASRTRTFLTKCALPGLHFSSP